MLGADSGAAFGETIGALYEATATIIPAGRVFILGQERGGPIVGSLITGVGLSETPSGIRIVRVAGPRVHRLGWFAR